MTSTDSRSQRQRARDAQAERWAPRWWIFGVIAILQLVLKAVDAVSKSPYTVDYTWATATWFLFSYGFLIGVPLFLSGWLLGRRRALADQAREGPSTGRE